MAAPMAAPGRRIAVAGIVPDHSAGHAAEHRAGRRAAFNIAGLCAAGRIGRCRKCDKALNAWKLSLLEQSARNVSLPAPVPRLLQWLRQMMPASRKRRSSVSSASTTLSQNVICISAQQRRRMSRRGRCLAHAERIGCETQLSAVAARHGFQQRRARPRADRRTRGERVDRPARHAGRLQSGDPGVGAALRIAGASASVSSMRWMTRSSLLREARIVREREARDARRKRGTGGRCRPRARRGRRRWQHFVRRDGGVVIAEALRRLSPDTR